MRVLIAVHGYPPTHNGGAERRAERLARGLASLGHAVDVLCIETPSASRPELHWIDSASDGVRVRRVSFNLGQMPDPVRWSYENPDLGAVAAEMIAEHKPDILHMFSGYLTGASVVQAAHQAGVRTVISLTDYWWLCHQINLVRTDDTRCDGPSPLKCARCQAELQRRFRLPAQIAPGLLGLAWQGAAALPVLEEPLGIAEQRRRRAVLLKTLSLADALIAPSHYLAETYIRHGAPAERIHVWRQGVELNICPLRKPDPAFRFGFLGQVKPHKGVHTLLDAWELLGGSQPRRLTIYGSAEGDPEYAAQIRARVAQLPDVSWPGTFAATGPWPVLAELDALVMPSRWVENSPNSILEAQAMGVPIVGTNLGGIAELVDHGRNGLLFAVDDAADLARQLQRLLDEPELGAHLRRNPIPFQAQPEDVMHKIELYTRLIRSGRAMDRSGELRAIGVC